MLVARCHHSPSTTGKDAMNHHQIGKELLSSCPSLRQRLGGLPALWQASTFQPGASIRSHGGPRWHQWLDNDQRCTLISASQPRCPRMHRCSLCRSSLRDGNTEQQPTTMEGEQFTSYLIRRNKDTTQFPWYNSGMTDPRDHVQNFNLSVCNRPLWCLLCCICEWNIETEDVKMLLCHKQLHACTIKSFFDRG
jgi:hypothetical protein